MLPLLLPGPDAGRTLHHNINSQPPPAGEVVVGTRKEDIPGAWDLPPPISDFSKSTFSKCVVAMVEIFYCRGTGYRREVQLGGSG